MKYDVGINLLSDKLSKFNIKNYLTVTIDLDYIETEEDIYYQIENCIWELYGVTLIFMEDYEQLDAYITEELFSLKEGV